MVRVLPAPLDALPAFLLFLGALPSDLVPPECTCQSQQQRAPLHQVSQERMNRVQMPQKSSRGIRRKTSQIILTGNL